MWVCWVWCQCVVVGSGGGRCRWCVVFFFFKQKTAYEMRISDWSSDVCSSDLRAPDVNGSKTVHEGQSCPRLRVEERIILGNLDVDPVRSGKIGRASCRERVCQYV